MNESCMAATPKQRTIGITIGDIIAQQQELDSIIKAIGSKLFGCVNDGKLQPPPEGYMEILIFITENNNEMIETANKINNLL